MKKVYMLSIVAIVLAAVAVEWRASRVDVASARASSSQIYIHGTPVCVLREGDGIVARVGKCGPGEDQDEEAPDESPFHGSPGRSLPPGHPPIGPDMDQEMRQDGSNRMAI